MTISNDHKQRISAGLRNAAAIKTCSHCGRRGALVVTDAGNRWVRYCKWERSGHCSWTGEVLFWKEGS